MQAEFPLKQKLTDLGIISECPFILGRKGIFKKFNILFDIKNSLIKFTEI
jgi:hypothetical protein